MENKQNTFLSTLEWPPYSVLLLFVTQLLVVDLSVDKTKTFIVSVSDVSKKNAWVNLAVICYPFEIQIKYQLYQSQNICVYMNYKIFLFQIGDESSILPPKLQSEILEALSHRQEAPCKWTTAAINTGVSETKVMLCHHKWLMSCLFSGGGAEPGSIRSLPAFLCENSWPLRLVCEIRPCWRIRSVWKKKFLQGNWVQDHSTLCQEIHPDADVWPVYPGGRATAPWATARWG